jgi:hypothetical protein
MRPDAGWISKCIVMHYRLHAEYRAVLARMVRDGEMPDEGDNFVYEIAFAASPCTIVSHSVRDFPAPELPWPGIVVRTPQQVLQEVTGRA